MWCIPPERNAEFVCAMENVLEVYKRPRDPERPVVCMDEKPKQLVKETRAPVPCAKGRPARIDYEYERNGTANVFLFVDPLRGWRRVEATERRTRLDWARQIKRLVDADYPRATKITLVMDNLNTHGAASLYEAFKPAEARRLAEKLEIVHTPRHGSWRERGRGRTGGPGEAEHRRSPPRPRGPQRPPQGLAESPQPIPPEGRLAVHHRRRPHQAQTPLPSDSTLTIH